MRQALRALDVSVVIDIAMTETAREAARRMVPRGRGTIIFTGATASLRGSAGFAGFSGGKFALRSLAQDMALV